MRTLANIEFHSDYRWVLCHTYFVTLHKTNEIIGPDFWRRPHIDLPPFMEFVVQGKTCLQHVPIVEISQQPFITPFRVAHFQKEAQVRPAAEQ